MSLHRSEWALLALYVISGIGLYWASQAAERDPGGASFAGLILAGVFLPTIGSVLATWSVWSRRAVSWTVVPLAAWNGFLAFLPMTTLSWATEGSTGAEEIFAASLAFSIVVACFMTLLTALPFAASVAFRSGHAWRIATPFLLAVLFVIVRRLLL